MSQITSKRPDTRLLKKYQCTNCQTEFTTHFKVTHCDICEKAHQNKPILYKKSQQTVNKNL